MNVAIIGYGKMGQEIEKILISRGHRVILKITDQNLHELTPEAIRKADVAIEFTSPLAAFDNVIFCLKNAVPVVSGTTGWNEKLAEAKRVCAEVGGTLFYASNFSLGVNIFFKLNELLARMMDRFDEYDVSIEETHHIHKKDSPSGTAITLAEAILAVSTHKSHWINEQAAASDTLNITSNREGEVPGTHSVAYNSDCDSIAITHSAKNRLGLARGAVMAAEYAVTHAGVLSMEDLLNIEI